MKHRFLLLTPFVGLFLLLAVLVFPSKSLALEKAPSHDSLNHIIMKLQGGDGPQQYNVSGSYQVNGGDKNVGFKYDSGKGGFFSDGLPGTGLNCDGAPNTSALREANQVKVTARAKSNGKVAGSTIVDLCGQGVPYWVTDTMSVSKAADAKQPGSVSGKATYKNDNGDAKPFQSGADGTLTNTDSNKNYNVNFDDKGNIKKIPNLSPGKYKIFVNYKPQDASSTQTASQEFTLKEGENKNLSLAAVKPTDSPNPNGVQDTNTDSTQPGLDCKVTWNPITWALCPFVKGMVSIVGSLDDLINSELSVGSPGSTSDPSQIFCDSSSNQNKNTLTNAKGQKVNTCQAYFKAWQTTRNIALGLMVIAGLIILIAQALGMEILDAYTIRKMLPRLLIAAVSITLSWKLMQFFVQLTNDLGFGVRWIIYQPFGGFHNEVLHGGGVVAAGLIGTAAILALSIVGLLSFAATAALAVFVAFIVMLFRSLLIIVLVIFAPIAIVAYILPNTQNAYKLWWDSFAKALLMFPIISAFIAAGRVFSLVANDGSAFGQLMGFAAYFAPYFLLPLAFRFAGGALRGVGGFINDRSRGGFDRLRNYRGKKVESNMKAMAAGKRYKASNPLASGFNRATRGIANAPSSGVTPWKWRSRYQAGLSQQKMTETNDYSENSAAFAAIKGNDDYLQATMETMGGGKTEDDWRRYLSGMGYEGRDLEQGVAAIRAAKRDTNDEVFHAAAVLANFATGTGFKEGGIGQGMAAINEAAGGDSDMRARMTAQSRGIAERANRWDLASPGFGAHFGETQAMNKAFQAIDSDRTLSAEQKASRKSEIMQEATTNLMEKGFYVKGAANAMVGMRGDSAKHIAPRLLKRAVDAEREFHAAQKSGDTRLAAEKERLMAQEYGALANIQDSLNYAAPEVARIFADEVFDSGVGTDSNGNAVTVMRRIQEMKESANPHYMQIRNDFEARSRGGGQDAGAARAGMLPNSAAAPPPPREQ
jgi:hypothetical protein